MRSDLPSGTVTFLFTDVEGSTRLLRELGAEAYAEALAEHRRLIREACAAHDGVEVDTQGDAFFFAFPTAPGAVAAASTMTEALAKGPIQVRVGLHTGTPLLTDEGYVGGDIHRAARIAACGHGGQVLVSASTATLVELELRDLGEHRLKDLSAPERIYQFGDREYPALRSLYRTNLPVPNTRFLGREAELAEVLSLLSREDTRLLTLTGPGGTGKTRLALQAAGLASDAYTDGVWWIALASLRDPTLVLETAAQVVGSKNSLAEHISDKAMLCLFDNFEQVVEAAPDLASVLAACPNLDLLVTSREPLHVTGEQEYAVPPLVHEEGVGFFLARARAVRPDFQVDEAVSEICQRLDDLPLALELAAARVKALSAPQICERLDERLPLLTGGARDLPERQRTLRATIEWSYDLLDEDEQRLFARLAVFQGGCTLKAAEQVCDADLDTLQSLVDKSLLRHSSERYWMLETIREYASGRLDASGEAEGLRQRHAEHFLALAEEAEPHLFSERSGEWLEILERELANIRTALDVFEESAQTECAVRMAGALGEFWAVKGHLGEGRRRVECALAADTSPTAARAKALNAAADLANGCGDHATARLRAEEGLALNRALGRTWGAADSLLVLGIAIIRQGDFVRAQELIDESVSLFRELGDERNTLEATRFLAWTYRELGDLHEARALLERNVRQAHVLGDNQVEARSLYALAGYALDDGRVEDAFRMLEDAYRVNRESGDLYWTPFIVCRFGHALADAGRAQSAAVVLSCGEALLEEFGIGEQAISRGNKDTLAVIHTQLDDDLFAKAWEQGRSLTADQAVVLALGSID